MSSNSGFVVEPAVEKVDTNATSTNSEPSTRDVDNSSKRGAIIRDITIGFADGLTVPFALTAGLSSLGSAKLVVIGGLAELFSGAISMGLGAYLAAVTERDQYLAREKQERKACFEKPEVAKQIIYETIKSYGLFPENIAPMAEQLASNPEQLLRVSPSAYQTYISQVDQQQFTMHFELRLAEPTVSRAWISAATMGSAYLIGGLIPMIPYFAMDDTTRALFISIGITVVVLLVFGFAKNIVAIGTRRSGLYGAVQTLCVGVLAAGASYGIVRALDSSVNGRNETGTKKNDCL